MQCLNNYYIEDRSLSSHMFHCGALVAPLGFFNVTRPVFFPFAKNSQPLARANG